MIGTARRLAARRRSRRVLRRDRDGGAEAELGQPVIFRHLYKRRVIRVFSPYAAPEKLEPIFADLSEWQAFKLLLPSAFKGLLYSQASRTAALVELQRMMSKALRDAEDRRS